MKVSLGEKIVRMVESPYSWYSYNDFKSSRIPKKVFEQMLEDSNHLMRMNGKGSESFFGGYALGFALRERLQVRSLLRRKPKTYQYVDPFRFVQRMEVHPDSLPDTISPLNQKAKPLVERVQVGEGLAYKIYVGSLAYLSLPVVKTQEIDDLSLTDLIKKYRLSGDDMYRNEFFRRTDEIVQKTVFSRFLSALAVCQDPERLVNAGKRGAENTLSRFDLEKGVLAETYLPYRILGEIKEELRALDPVPRSIRSAVKKIRPLIEEARKNDEALSIDQLVELTGKSKETVTEAYKIVIDDRNSNPVSLSQRQYRTDSEREVRLSDKVPDEITSNRDPTRKIETEDTLSFLLGFLDPRSQEIVVRYYLEKESMKTIGQSLGLSESRISQDHDRIMERLKELAVRMEEV